MLARWPLCEKFQAFNKKWGAPAGSKLNRVASREELIFRMADRIILDPFPRFRGHFGFQANNTTRVFEYPWCYFASDLKAGMRAVEIGGSLSGFQFVLSKVGVEVINVDPGLAAHGRGWPVDKHSINRLNDAFGTTVELRNCLFHEAKLADNSVDRVFSISVIEHIPRDEIRPLMKQVWNVLRPKGLFIATIDLFLNIKPFSSNSRNEFGENIPITEILDAAPFTLVTGIPSELYGLSDFDVDSCMCQLDKFIIGRYPTLVQCIVLKKQ